MSSIANLTTSYIDTLSLSFYLKQVLVIVCLFLYGMIIIDFSGKLRCVIVPSEERNNDSNLFKNTDLSCLIKKSILAYPVGLSVYIIISYIMLVVGITFNRVSVILGMIAVVIAMILLLVVKERKSGNSEGIVRNQKFIDGISFRSLLMVIVLLPVVAVAAFSTLGLVPISISNDSMYFFHRYPECIVSFEGLRDQFDYWLTDTGLGAIVIDTIPGLFGFGESFGMREFFQIDFILFFGVMVFDNTKKYFEKKGRIIATVIVTLLLVSATPFMLLSHWAMANVYFMELFFMSAYSFKFIGGKESLKIVPYILMLALFTLRIEGIVFVIWLALCISIFYKNGKKLSMFVMLPATFMFGGYVLKIYTAYIMDDQCTFLTPLKAILVVVVLALMCVYLYVIENRLLDFIGSRIKLFKDKPGLLYFIGLLLVNVLLFVWNPELYFGNIIAFSKNLFRQSGWGMLPFFVIGACVILIVERIFLRMDVKKINIKDDLECRYNVLITVGFVFVTLASAFGRGTMLYEDTGDSGNRVMLQVVPLVVFMFSDLFFKLTCDKDTRR